ncbi:MAG: hypothetical protein A2Y77_07830 [Planctomycetes bacterium RBG_13_62_9]|nr:MAG: hypothetical protein A2Y77_07830 [Planctomycetes bacterium RBG_13_62_9]
MHTLIALGYAAFTPADWARAEEEDITGELVDAIDDVLDSGTPRWAGRYFVHEEPRERHKTRKGKGRKRLDIRLDSSEVRPRARLRFEAKRLGPNHGTSVYLGGEGLQRFLDGRYARNDPIAGMLGYVQAGNPGDWALKIGQAISKDAVKLGLRNSSPWRAERLADRLAFTYCSGHDRPSVGNPVQIFHTLLLFN